MADDNKTPETNPDETAALDEAQRAAAIAALAGGTVPVAAEAPAPVISVKRTGVTVDFGGKSVAVVLSRHVNDTVKGQNVVARRGDLITATPAFVARAAALGAVAKVDG